MAVTINGSGQVPVQVLQTIKTSVFSTSSTSYVDITGLSVSITPSSSTSKILILCNVLFGHDNGDDQVQFAINRNSTQIITDRGSVPQASEARFMYSNIGMNYLDSPATTSATTYTIQMKVGAGTGYINARGYSPSTSDGYSSITVMEISQ
jgi:hypothetical protein